MPSFGTVLAQLRQDAELSQRKLAGELHVSQALLSHYENGTREPGLAFVCHACDYFGVSSDYLLGRVEDETGSATSFPSVNRLDRFIDELGDQALCHAISDYMDAAAGRMLAHLENEADPLHSAELTSIMAASELTVVRKSTQGSAQAHDKASQQNKHAKPIISE